MKLKSVFTAIVLVVGLALTAVVLPADGNATFQPASAQEEEIITIRQIADFLQDKKAHYPLSDEFIERYQQTSGGYLDTAKKAGIVVDKQLHLPDQKWHFFDSWLYPSIEDGSLTWDADAQRRVYTNLLCPELLLWIYEACGVDPVKVKTAKEVAEQGKVQGANVSTIAKNMRAIVSWEDIANNVKGYKPADSITLSSGNLRLTVGQNATLTATIRAEDDTGAVSWSVTEGNDFVTIEPNGRSLTVTALAKGTAKIKAVYGETLIAECTVTVKEQSVVTGDFVTKYNLQGVSTAQIKTVEDALAVFKLDGDGDGIVASVSAVNGIYGGGSGGSGENRWKSLDMLKIGTGSITGSITVELNAEVVGVKITGYVHGANCEIKVGDGADESNAVTRVCSDMTVAGKQTIEDGQATEITVTFENATDSVTIATLKKVPLYITSIEFILASETAR